MDECRDLIRERTPEKIYRELAAISRVHPLPGDLPHQNETKELIRFAKRILKDENYWQTAPSHFPVPEEELAQLREFATQSSRIPGTPELVDQIESKGFPFQEVRLVLEGLLKTWRTGKLPSDREP